MVKNLFKIKFFPLMVFVGLIGQLSAQGLLFEDFSSQRKNHGGDDLFAAYLGEDPQQTYSIENGMLKVVGAPNTGSCDPGCGIYMHFFPAPYDGPWAFAHSYLKSGSWDPNVNRMRFKLKCSNNVTRRSDGGGIFDIGTYSKSPSDTNPSNQGAHYYHGFDPNIYANRWMMVEITRVPQHQVGDNPSVNYPEDPTWSGQGVHYLDGLTRFYMDTSDGASWANTTCYFDDFYFDKVAGEPETYVASITAVHTGSAYEVSWAAPKNQNVTYNIRYSKTSMKANGFNSGTDGGSVSNPGNDYTGTIWKSPAMAEQQSFYVAIQPSGQTAFTEVYIPGMDSTAPAAQVTCDINKDGKVDSQDVALAQEATVGTAACSADLDGNGRCDAVDAQRVINASLGQTCRVGQ